MKRRVLKHCSCFGRSTRLLVHETHHGFKNAAGILLVEAESGNVIREKRRVCAAKEVPVEGVGLATLPYCRPLGSLVAPKVCP